MMRRERAEARTQLADRKVHDRAKRLSMQRHQIAEPEAYARIRKAAMDKGLPDQQDDSAIPGVAHAMNYPTGTMGPPEQGVRHGAEQGALPARAVDARVLRAVRLSTALRGAGASVALTRGLRLPGL